MLIRLKHFQRGAIEAAAAHFRAIAIVLALLVAAALGVLPFLGGTFMPDFREGHFVMQVSSAVPGTSLDQMLEVGARISAEVLALPYVQSVEQQVGRAELGEDTVRDPDAAEDLERIGELRHDFRALQTKFRFIRKQQPT